MPKKSYLKKSTNTKAFNLKRKANIQRNIESDHRNRINQLARKMEKYISRPGNYKIDLFTTKNLDKRRKSAINSQRSGINS